MSSVPKVLRMMTLLKEFNAVDRDLASLSAKGRMDNDVEHSYRVAMLCWFLKEEYKLKLDMDKVLRYALVHDLAEAYAGDVSIYANYSQKQKEKNEAKALAKMERRFPKQKSVWKAIRDYERKRDPESRFVYLVEKLEPIYLVVLAETDHWRVRDVGLEEFITRKQAKIKDLDTAAQFLNREMMAFLRKHRKRYFD